MSILFYCIGVMILFIVNLILLVVLLKVAAFLVKILSKRKFIPTLSSNKTSPKFTVGFFHPFCNSGKLLE